MNKIHNIRPFKFVPYLKSVLWGGERIAQYKGIHTDQHKIGESWEISGVQGHESVVAEGDDKGLILPELIHKYKGALVGNAVYEKYGDRFPLLVKIIDAKRDLSLQVHPNDELAHKRHESCGKTELWYIIDACGEAKIYAGMAKNISKDDLRRLVAGGEIMDAVVAHDSHAGDLFYLPAGRLHSIGAGNLLAEIQQTSDITYRVYDFNRLDVNGKPRELHTELAIDAIDYEVHDNYKIDYEQVEDGVAELMDCEYFDVRKINVNSVCNLDLSHQDSFCIVMCLAGAAEVTDNFMNTVPLRQGETILVPAVSSSLSIEGRATLLSATM